MSGPSAAPVQAVVPMQPATAAHGVLQRCGPVPCDCARDEERGVLHRTAVQPVSAPAPPVPPSVREVLGSPGAPLASDARAFHEPRFGHDFSTVRVHADTRAAESAAAVGARAYTVGNHIVLGQGAPSPSTPAGRRLLAHELVHVVQQSGTPQRAPLTVGAPGTPAEREADDVAARVAGGEEVRIQERGDAADVVQGQFSCADLIGSTGGAAVSGIGVPAHDAIESHFRSLVGGRFWQQPIPGASFAPWRSEDRDERRRGSSTGTEQVSPQTLGGRAGPGTPDLGFREGGMVELAEVKPAILGYGAFGGLLEGEAQLLNYLAKGNSPENSGWRGRRRITSFVPMPPSRATWPTTLTTSGGRKIEAGWCAPGLVGYRALSSEEAETILCGVSDQKAIDRFLNAALDGAQRAVDSFIDTSVDAVLTRRLSTMSLQEGLVLVNRYGRSALRELLNSRVGPGGGVLLDVMPDDLLVAEAGRWLQDRLGPEVESLIRTVVMRIKARLLAEVRAYLRQQLRTYLQESLAAVCAAAAVGATVSVAQLLRRFGRDLGKRFAEGVLVVARAWAAAVAAEIAKDLAIALVVAIAVVAVLFFLPEILAGLAAAAVFLGGVVVAGGEFVAAAASAAALLGPRLIPMLNELVRVVVQSSPAIQPALQGAAP